MRVFVLFLLGIFSVSSAADVPKKIRTAAAKNTARAILSQCTKTENVKECLEEHGATCMPVEGRKRQEHLCKREITTEFTGAGKRDKPPELVEKYEIQFVVYMSKKGWRGKTGPVVLLSSTD